MVEREPETGDIKALGTPMGNKMANPRKYADILAENKKVYGQAFTKLIIASCVSFFFILA